MLNSLLFPTKDLCYLCKAKTPYIKQFICSECRDRLVIIHKHISIDSEEISNIYYSTNYNRFLKEFIHGFKFNGKSYLYKPFSEIMIDTIREKGIENNIDLILFVPIHYRKEAIRGYNQTELLADYIARSINKPISKKNLVKSKWTKEQNQLTKLERSNNLGNSFKIKDPSKITNKRILLIDDIITTGSTMKECAKVLINSGAKEVIGLALTSSKV